MVRVVIPPTVILPEAVMLPWPPTPSCVVPEVTRPVTLIVPAGAASVSVVDVMAGVTSSLPPELVNESTRAGEVLRASTVKSPFVETVSVLEAAMLEKVRFPEPVIVTLWA